MMSRGRDDGSASDGPTVVVDDERESGMSDHVVEVDRWTSLVTDVLADEGLSGRPVEVHVHFVDESAIEDLNREYMGGSGPTDVLAFPVDDPAMVPDGIPVLLGDVVVCPSVAARQAPTHAGDFDSEISLLIVHGVLHLLGYDHAEPVEAEAMQAREREHLARYGLVRP